MTGFDAARAAYTAYAVAVGGIAHTGQPMPSWAELPEMQRKGWRAAAVAVLHDRAEERAAGYRELREQATTAPPRRGVLARLRHRT